MDRKGRLFIIAAPSGAGKTSLIRALVGSDPELSVSVSYTTRPRRPNEIQGVSYHFIDKASFKKMIDEDALLEYADVFDYQYGTGKAWVADQLDKGLDIILEIDWQGARQIRKACDDTVGIFILPPSFKALEDRLYSRGEPEETVRRRMRDASATLEHYHEFDHFVINDDFECAITSLRGIIHAKRYDSPLKSQNIDDFVHQLIAQATKIQ